MTKSPSITTLGILFSLILWIALGSTGSVSQPIPRYAGVSPGPVGVNAKVRMAFQTIDVTIEEEDEATVATVRCVFKLHNADKLEGTAVPLGFPKQAGNDLHFGPEGLRDLSLRVDGQEIELISPFGGQIEGDSGADVWHTHPLSLSADGKVTVQMDYSQDLGDGLLLDFHYVLLPSMGWEGPIDSARVTVHLPLTTTLEQLITAEPEGASFDGQRLTWHFTDFEPRADIHLVFVKPSFWREILAARQAVVRDPTSVAAHHALGSLYGQLSLAEAPASSSEAINAKPFPFYAQAISELETSKRLDPTVPQVYLDLATLYRAKASRTDGSLDTRYLALVVAELEEVLPHIPNSESAIITEVRQSLGESCLYLAETSRLRGRYEAALSYLERAARALSSAPDAAPSIGRVEREQRLSYISWAKALLDRGEVAEAIQVIEQGLGEDFLVVEEGGRPRFSAIQAQVRTEPGQRRMTWVLKAYPCTSPQLTAEVKAWGDNLSKALGNPVGIEVSGEDYILRMALSFADGADLLKRLNLLAEALPPDPDLAPLRAILRPTSFTLGGRDRYGKAFFSEVVDLVGAGSSVQVAKAATAATREALAAHLPLSGEEETHELRLEVLRLYENAWQRLLAESRFNYEVTLPLDPPVSRAWSLKLGETGHMELKAQARRGGFVLPTILITAAAGAILIFILIVLIWKVAPL